MRVAKVSVFFIDDLQVVRPGEEGSSQLITETAARLGIPLIEHELETYFRCGGSEGTSPGSRTRSTSAGRRTPCSTRRRSSTSKSSTRRRSSKP
jgi:hypothetical protein